MVVVRALSQNKRADTWRPPARDDFFCPRRFTCPSQTGLPSLAFVMYAVLCCCAAAMERKPYAEEQKNYQPGSSNGFKQVTIVRNGNSRPTPVHSSLQCRSTRVIWTLNGAFAPPSTLSPSLMMIPSDCDWEAPRPPKVEDHDLAALMTGRPQHAIVSGLTERPSSAVAPKRSNAVRNTGAM